MDCRFRRSVRRPRKEQRYIFATSQMYNRLPPEQQARIRALCDKAGGEYAAALLVYVTTERSSTSIGAEFAVSEATLQRVARKYFREFPVPFV